MEFVEFDFDVALFGDFEGVADGVGGFGEADGHFLGGAEVELLGAGTACAWCR